MEDKSRAVKETAAEIYTRLQARYPLADCELGFNSVFELLVAVILSAQCTDKRVNIVTEKLFKVYSTPAQFAEASLDEIISFIRPCGYYNSKALAIKSASADICARYGGEVPKTMEELLTLRGVGRKTASVIIAVGYGGAAVAVDTHVFRVSNRTGIAAGKTPLIVEKGLRELYNPADYGRVHSVLLFHGRYTCKSQRPNCGECNITDLCAYYADKT